MRGLTTDRRTSLAEAAERFDRIAIACSFQKEASVILDLAVRGRRSSTSTSSRSTPACCSTRRIATWRAFEEHYGIDDRRRPRRLARAPVGDRPGRVLRRAQGRPAARAPRRRRRLGDRHAPRAVADARRHAARSAGTTSTGCTRSRRSRRWTEKDVWRRIPERDLPYHELHDQGYALDRLRAVHAAGRGPRGPLGRHRQARVRPARRLSAPSTRWTRSSSSSASASASSSG